MGCLVENCINDADKEFKGILRLAGVKMGDYIAHLCSPHYDMISRGEAVTFRSLEQIDDSLERVL